MLQLRVTKYDPALRSEAGHYLRDEWTHFAQVGRVVGGEAVTLSEYEEIESAYIQAAIAFLREAGIEGLHVVDLENSSGFAPVPCGLVETSSLDEVVRCILREKYWCRLEASHSFLHFGWDYYMYVGVPAPCPRATQEAVRLGLFVEEFTSPYHRELTPRP